MEEVTGGGGDGCGQDRSVARAAGRRSIAWRILFSASLTVVLALLISGAYFLGTQRSLLEQSFRLQSQIQTDWIGAFAVEHLIAKDYPALEHAISAAGASDENIVSIEVIHEGYPAATFRRGGQRTGIEFRSDIRWQGKSEILLGEVRATYSPALYDKLLAHGVLGALVTVLAICIALFFTLRFMLHRTVLDPVAELIRRTEQEIARALPESELPAEPAGPVNEIQLFDQRFSALLEGLKRHDAARDLAEKKLTEHRDNLERLIEERTQSLRLAQEEAQRLNRAKSEFLAAASHDLRQPLQAINLFHAALKATPLNDEQLQLMEYLSLSHTSLGDLLNALLDVSKLDAGLIEANMETVPVEWIFEKIDAEFSSLARGKRLRFKYFYPRAPLALRTDGKLLLSLLGNLVGNGIKYTSRGGVLVSVRRRSGEALVQVWDTGEGIPEEYRERIFDEFFQIGNQERDRSKGVGLGLSIVRRLSRLLGTEVRCLSQPGRGSVFEFSLPLASDGGYLAPAPEVPDSLDGFHGSIVAVVEDDMALATAIRLACEARGMTVLVHPNAESALGDAAILEADYYLTDFRLPGMNGLELLDRLQERIGYPINAVVLTGELASTEFLKQSQKGFAVLFKPVAFVKLLEAWRSQGGAGKPRDHRQVGRQVPDLADAAL